MTDYLNNSNKTTLLFKKFQNKTQAAIDVTTNESGGTSFFKEQKKSLNNIYNSDIFIENIEKNLPDDYKLSTLDACGNIPGSKWNTTISNQDYSESSFLIPNTNLIFYKEIYLNPVSGTNNAWWFIPPIHSDQITDNNLLKDMIPYNFNSISLATFSPIVKFWNESQWRTQGQNNTSGLNWLIDYASGILQFYQDDSKLNQLNIDCNSTDENKRPKISFIKYVGNKGLQNFTGSNNANNANNTDITLIKHALEYYLHDIDFSGNTYYQTIDEININGNIKGNSINCMNLHVDSSGSFNSNVNILGNLIVHGSFVNTSDKRLKENNKDISNGIVLIKKLKPQIYDKRNKLELNSNNYYIKESGFIAQDIEEIEELNHLINKPKNIEKEPYNINYIGLIAYNTAAIKELDTIVQNQQTEINEQNSKIQELENKLYSQETLINQLISRIVSLENA